MTTNPQTLHKLSHARVGLILDHPFFGQLALRLQFVERVTEKTMAVDGKHIFYNPQFVNSISSELTKAIIAHEVMHCVFDHIGRRNGRSPRRWNQAADYAINPILEDSGFDFEGTGLLNPAYKNMTADQIYMLLPESSSGDPLDECLDSSTDAIEAADWAVAVVQAATAAKQHNKLPESLARLVSELTEPKLNWRAQLRHFVTERCKDDYSWTRPNRKFFSQGIYLPSLYNEQMGQIVVAIDTSGSIDQPTLDAFGAEIKSIVQTIRPTNTTAIYCDAVINHVDEFSPNDELHFNMHGGGGTDFCPPFQFVKDQNLTPKVFIYLTDGYGPFPSAPDYPVIWCMTTAQIAPFGTTLFLTL